MTNERETFFQPLTLIDYNIAGNSFRAYYDADNKLIFTFDVLEDEINGESSSPGSSGDMTDQYADPGKYAVEDVISTVTTAVPSYERFTITE